MQLPDARQVGAPRRLQRLARPQQPLACNSQAAAVLQAVHAPATAEQPEPEAEKQQETKEVDGVRRRRLGRTQCRRRVGGGVEAWEENHPQTRPLKQRECTRHAGV
eukprot:79606-Chlamydomonas_euryale.AAC.1